MTEPFKGLHRVRKRLAAGSEVFYYYAWRGGPRIHAVYGTPEFAGEFAEARRQVSGRVRGSFDEAITAYLASPKFKSLAVRTRKEYRALIDMIRDQFGSARLSYFNNPQTRKLVYNWRDRFAATPRKADFLIAVLSAILSYLVDRSQLERNVVRGMKKLYSSDRSNIVWTDQEIKKVCEFASNQLAWTIRLEALTGMRTGDLIAVPWTAIQKNCIDWKTSKNKVDVFIPLTPALRDLLDEIPKAATTIVTNTKGRPWTECGLQTMWGLAKKASGVKGKRFHDLRGTTATKFCLVGLTDTEIAAIIGWSPTRVAEIRARYVDREMIVQGVIDKIEQNKDRTKTVNRGVNRAKEQS
jgi:integrase